MTLIEGRILDTGHQTLAEIQDTHHPMTSTHILLIEDNPDDSYLIQKMIKPSSVSLMELQAVTCLMDALNHISQFTVDAILLDLSLPDSDGLATVKTLQQHASNIPIIVLTGLNDDSLGIQAVKVGAQDYLVKGEINEAVLVRSIHYAIERKHLEQNLHQSNQELEVLYQKVSTLEQLKTDMIRIAAHDIGSLLNVAAGHLYLLTDADAAPEPLSTFQERSISEINAVVQQMITLTKDILSLERIEAQQALLTQPINLSGLVQTIFTQYQAQVVSKHQRFELHLAESITVKGDAVQLQEAITNILSNASKYTPEDGQIEIRLYQKDVFAVLEIQDSGYGVPDELQPKLFQPFYRAKTADIVNIPGTGLGLHLVKNIIERHHGRMIFTSTYGEGSTFGFQLPIFNTDHDI